MGHTTHPVLPAVLSSGSQDHSDLVADLLKELSNHNERVDERKGALVELLKITREDSLAVWDEHFKTILLLLLETLGDKDVGILYSCSSDSTDHCYFKGFTCSDCVKHLHTE